MSTLLEPAITPANAAAIDAALKRIPPLWPLRHFVAVNPFVGLLERPFGEACAILQKTTGAMPLLSPQDYLAAWQSGEIRPEDIAAVAGESRWTTAALIEKLQHLAEGETEASVVATVADLLDHERPRAHWSVFVTEEISKWCGTFFDENQTTWNSPWKHLGLYAAWRDAAAHDYNPESFGLKGFRGFVAKLPEEADEAIAHCLRILDPQRVELVDFLHRQLTTISGWAGYVQYRVREDALRGKSNPALKELLAVRLAYDAALYVALGNDGVLRANWRHQTVFAPDAKSLDALLQWQAAYERSYQKQLAEMLTGSPSALPTARPVVQAVFCIDVRSEVFRRHLEAELPGTQTIGFAGFFGFPVAHRSLGATNTAARCPVLLVPPVETCDPQENGARAQLAQAGAWKAFQNSATSCFSFVESAGLAFGASLTGAGKATGPTCSRVAPEFAGGTVTLETRVALAEGALRNMSLTKNFARLVLICGHGSRSANNPYASALDCGACGGHAGDVNARLAATTLNEPDVRTGLAARGIVVPSDTVFVAGLHNTTTDDVSLLDEQHVPATHALELAALRTSLGAAGRAARQERAPTLGLAKLRGAKLDAAVRARAADISQVRPEWGLANNAALVAAPRSRTAGLRLDGRVFLHDYDAAADGEDKVLTLILCAPVVVASWINLQYYASRVDPQRYGSGNKVLHNVLGGLGVMEGNAGDLKTGLPLQSIHDGVKFVHEPRRLTVYIEANRERIGAVLAAQPAVRQLFDNGWIHLVSLEGPTAWRYAGAEWRRLV